MTRLAWASLRIRRTAFLGTFIAAVLAVTLIGGASLLLFSVLTASPTTHRFDAADVMVGGDRAISLTTVKHKKDKVKVKTKTEQLTGASVLPADWAAKIAAVPGVADPVADFSFPVEVSTDGGSAAAIAHGWGSARLTPFSLRTGTAPHSGEIVVDTALATARGLRVGDELRLTTRTGERTVQLSGIVTPPGADRLTEQSSIFVAPDDVGADSGLAGPTAIGVVADGGVAADALARRIAAALGAESVYTGSAKVNADLPSALPDYIAAISIFGFVIGITTFAAVFVLTGTVNLAVRQRLPELALLRATGATPRQLARMLGTETLIVSAAAIVAGALPALITAQVIAARFRTLGAVPAQFAVSGNVAVLLLAGLATMLVAQASTWLAARRAVRIAPAQALNETVVEPRSALTPRALIAVSCTAGAIAVLTLVPLDGPFGMGMTFISSTLLLSAVAAAGPLLVRLLVAPVSRVSDRTGISGWLAGAFTRAENRRVTAVAVPLALMFAINAPMLMNGGLSRDLAAQQERLRTAAASGVATGAFPLASVSRLKGVDYAATIPTRLIIDQGGKPEDYPSQGLVAAGRTVLDLGFSSGRWDPAGLSVSEYLARSRGWQIGQSVRMWLPDGTPSTMRVTGIFEYSRGFGDLVADGDLIAKHDPQGLVSTVVVNGEVDPVRAALPSARIETTGAAAAAGDADEQQGAWEIMIAVSLGFTAIAVVNTFAVAASVRGGQFGQLRLIGATRRQLRRMVGREVLLTVSVGLGLGVLVTSIVVGAFSLAQDGTLRLVVHPGGYGLLLAATGLLGILAGTIPARLVLRRVR